MNPQEPSLGFMASLIGAAALGGLPPATRSARSMMYSKPPGTRAKDRKRRKAERQRKKRGG